MKHNLALRRLISLTRRARRIAPALLMGLAGGALGVAARPAGAAPVHVYRAHLRPVKVVASSMIDIGRPGHPALLPLIASADLARPQPGVTRAVIVVHGKLRNADTYYATLRRAAEAAGAAGQRALLIAPQFLATIDMAPNHVPADVLHWHGTGWMGGEPAAGPQPLSSYAALDALLARLAERANFPQLRDVVLAGFSGGAQVAQRYALAAQGLRALARRGIRVSFVVASPSSYAYFDKLRPVGDPRDGHVTFARYDAAQCPGYDDWKYGLENLPPYLAGSTPQRLEQRYVRRDITYFVGGDDNDPAQRALDKSCPAEAQGSQRLARATAYYAYLRQRHPNLAQPMIVVPGAGHNEARVLTTPCAQSALFGVPGCHRLQETKSQ
ncbi:MAG: alpha/beta hydrolase [Burkholderiales bacterium]|nr:alpha/beta hydrolase [Burkholderiales bacterium]